VGGCVASKSGLDPACSTTDLLIESMDTREHTNIRALGIAHLLLGPCHLFGAYLLWQAVIRNQSMETIGIVGISLLVGAGLVLLASGVGIMARKKWALPFMFVAGLSQLPAVPVGTLVGVWTLAVHSKLSKRRKRRMQSR
jgi:hypothetical protein